MVKVKVKSLSPVQLFATLWTVAYQASPSMGFYRQEYQSGLPFPSPGESSWPRNWTQVSCIAGRRFTLWATIEEGNHLQNKPLFLFFGGFKITADGDCSHEIKRRLLLGRKGMTNLDSILKSRHYFANKGPSSQGYGFSSGYVWMWELDYEENWAPKNWCFWIVVLEKTLESPLDCKEIQPVHSKGDQPWDFFGRTDAKAETPVLWPPRAKS